MIDIYVLYSTFATSDEAFFVAGELLEKHLIACANIHDAQSVYRWEGTVCKEREAVLLAKTRHEKLDDAIALIKSLHSYELPCIVSYRVAEGFSPFLQWVADETA